MYTSTAGLDGEPSSYVTELSAYDLHHSSQVQTRHAKPLFAACRTTSNMGERAIAPLQGTILGYKRVDDSLSAHQFYGVVGQEENPIYDSVYVVDVKDKDGTLHKVGVLGNNAVADDVFVRGRTLDAYVLDMDVAEWEIPPLQRAYRVDIRSADQFYEGNILATLKTIAIGQVNWDASLVDRVMPKPVISSTEHAA